MTSLTGRSTHNFSKKVKTRVNKTCISEDESAMEENILEIFELPVLKYWARVRRITEC